MSILKQRYNELLEREKKAELFFETCSDEQFEMFRPEYNNIVAELDELLMKIGRYKSDEILNGFICTTHT